MPQSWISRLFVSLPLLLVLLVTGCSRRKGLDGKADAVKAEKGADPVGQPKDATPKVDESANDKAAEAIVAELKGTVTRFQPDEIAWIYLDGKNVTDAAFAKLPSLRSLEQIRLYGTEVTDKGLANMAVRFPNLKVLDFEKNPIDGSFLKGSNLPVQDLRLVESSANDAIFDIVATLPNLAELRLSDTKITDAGLAKVAKLKKLRRIDADRTAITDKGVQALAGHPALESVHFGFTALTDDSIKSLKGLPELSDLYVVGTKITDKSVPDIKSIPKLKRLSITATEITPEAAEGLIKDLPKVEIRK